MWKGTEATLKANPTMVSIAPATATERVSPPPEDRAVSIWSRKTEPVAPYSSEGPIKVTAVDITETRKNFTAASAARGSRRRSPVIAKAGSDTTSSATTNVTRSREAAMVQAPVAEHRSRKFHSASGVRPSWTATVPISATTAVPNRTTAQKTSVNRSTTNEQGAGPPSTPRGPSMQKVDAGWRHDATVGTAATATATTVIVAGPQAAVRLRGGAGARAPGAGAGHKGPRSAWRRPREQADQQHEDGCQRQRGRSRDRQPVDVLGHPSPPKKARAAAATGARRNPGATPRTTVSTSRGDQVAHSMRSTSGRSAPAIDVPGSTSGVASSIEGTPSFTGRTDAGTPCSIPRMSARKYADVRITPNAATTARTTNVVSGRAPSGYTADRIASISPQKPASPGRPMEAIAAKANTPANRGIFP